MYQTQASSHFLAANSLAATFLKCLKTKHLYKNVMYWELAASFLAATFMVKVKPWNKDKLKRTRIQTEHKFDALENNHLIKIGKGG